MAIKKIKKALIVLPSLENGDGSAASIMNYYKPLSKEWNVDFLLLRETDNMRTRQIAADGGKIFVLPQKNKYSHTVAKAIAAIIKNGKYLVVHINLPGHIAYRALLEAKNSCVPIRIFHCHNPKNDLNLKTKLSTWIYDTLCLRYANKLFACSESAGISRFGNKNFYIIKNAIITERFLFNPETRAELRKELGVKDSILVGVIGRITAQKNPFYLVDCFAALKSKEPLACLLWIGEGELIEQVKKRLESQGLLEDCIFLGRREDVGRWYSAMDLFLLPSFFEGLGIVFLEAQCSGLPCFGSDCVPVDTEITELMHRLPLRKTPDEWADLMINTLKSSTKRTSRERDLRNAGFDLSSVEDNLRTLYDFLLTEGECHE